MLLKAIYVVYWQRLSYLKYTCIIIISFWKTWTLIKQWLPVSLNIMTFILGTCLSLVKILTTTHNWPLWNWPWPFIHLQTSTMLLITSEWHRTFIFHTNIACVKILPYILFLIFLHFDLDLLHCLHKYLGHICLWQYSQILISRSWWDYFLPVQITRSAN